MKAKKERTREDKANQNDKFAKNASGVSGIQSIEAARSAFRGKETDTQRSGFQKNTRRGSVVSRNEGLARKLTNKSHSYNLD